MANKLTQQKIKAILASERPEVEVDEDAAQETSAMADNSAVQTDAPDLEFLIQKFLKGQRVQRQTAARDSSRATNASKIVRVKPAGSKPTDADGTGQRKVVVVSAKDESVIAEQG